MSAPDYSMIAADTTDFSGNREFKLRDGRIFRAVVRYTRQRGDHFVLWLYDGQGWHWIGVCGDESAVIKAFLPYISN